MHAVCANLGLLKKEIASKFFSTDGRAGTVCD
jgi:hypothetical protein